MNKRNALKIIRHIINACDTESEEVRTKAKIAPSDILDEIREVLVRHNINEN